MELGLRFDLGMFSFVLRGFMSMILTVGRCFRDWNSCQYIALRLDDLVDSILIHLILPTIFSTF